MEGEALVGCQSACGAVNWQLGAHNTLWTLDTPCSTNERLQARLVRTRKTEWVWNMPVIPLQPGSTSQTQATCLFMHFCVLRLYWLQVCINTHLSAHFNTTNPSLSLLISEWLCKTEMKAKGRPVEHVHIQQLHWVCCAHSAFFLCDYSDPALLPSGGLSVSRAAEEKHSRGCLEKSRAHALSPPHPAQAHACFPIPVIIFTRTSTSMARWLG